MNDVEISILGAEELSAELAMALEGHDYAEVEASGITGAEGDLSWLIAAILGSPVVSKVLDVLEKSVARRKISKVSITKDGKVEIEGATPDEAAKVLRALVSAAGADEGKTG